MLTSRCIPKAAFLTTRSTRGRVTHPINPGTSHFKVLHKTQRSNTSSTLGILSPTNTHWYTWVVDAQTIQTEEPSTSERKAPRSSPPHWTKQSACRWQNWTTNEEIGPFPHLARRRLWHFFFRWSKRVFSVWRRQIFLLFLYEYIHLHRLDLLFFGVEFRLSGMLKNAEVDPMFVESIP